MTMTNQPGQETGEALQAEIDRLTQQVESLTKELEAEREWEDVPPGEYADGYFLLHEDRTITVFSNDGNNWIIFEAPQGMHIRRKQEAHDATNAD